MTKKYVKLLAMLLAGLTVMSVLPLSVLAACDHDYEKVYTIENEKMHSYVSECTRCGEVKDGWGYAGWNDHTYDRYGECTACGHQQKCTHPDTETVYAYENSDKHSYYAKCLDCGEKLEGSGYAGWDDHDFRSKTCRDCGFTQSCTHEDSETVYNPYTTSKHKVASKCYDCGILYNTVTETHTWDNGNWEYESDLKHSREKECMCGETKTETAAHDFQGNRCSGCGCRQEEEPAVEASVSLSAESDNGYLGSAGGEISADSVPASYTVYAAGEGCEVTKIAYVKDGTRYTEHGDSVTITANSEKDFTTITFTAYTDVGGVRAAFTVNHKYVRKNTSYYMWETSHEATIRSITGNGLNKKFAHTMTIPNAYDSQTNLTDAQIAEIQNLIGRNDGKIYTVNYTREVTVYTPAELSYNGRKIVHGTFDGNNASEIADCLSRWDWNKSSAEAIRQAASSSLTFTTSAPVDCQAVWVDTTTGREIYDMTFGSGSVSSSGSSKVSVSFDDFPDAGAYVYESLSYSGDRTGTSTDREYAQTYTASSAPLTVTFYCHPEVSEGSITVRVVDGDTMELIDGAEISCEYDTVEQNPCTFTDLEPGTYYVSASAEGYTSADSNVTIGTGSSKTVTLKLYKEAGTIAVTVRDAETRQPIAGAEVEGDDLFDYTNNRGVATFEDVPFGRHTFTATADGYGSGSGRVTISQNSPSNNITIYLDPIPETGKLTVIVLDADTDKPIADATVSGYGSRQTTDNRGRVTYTDVRYGTYAMTAAADGYESGSEYATLSDFHPSESVTIYLTPLATSGEITVKVVDAETDKPISGARVSGDGRSKTTGNNGMVTFEDFDFGKYTFTATKNGYYDNSATAKISEDDKSDSITIYLNPIPVSGTVTVYVKDKETNAAIPGATVVTGRMNGTTDQNGMTVFNWLAFDTHSFTASAPDYESASKNATITERKTETTVTIYLDKQVTDLSPEAVCNGTIYKGSTIMVSAEITNDGAVELTPDKPATVTMTAKRNGGTVFDTQTRTVIIPAKAKNLVWFTVAMPQDGYTSDSVTFDFSVIAPTGVKETNLSNNTDSLTKTVSDLPARDCDDAGLETEEPSGFVNSRYDKTECTPLTWEVYEWNGGFVKKTYNAVLDMTAKLYPNANAGYKVETAGIWTTRSGYGVDMEVTVTVDSLSAEITGTAKVDSYYPEHNYSAANNQSDRLELVSGKYVFRENGTSVNNARMHGIPLWFPDGAYGVKYYAYDVWCPAGMLSGYTNAYVNISGDMYDDLYTG